MIPLVTHLLALSLTSWALLTDFHNFIDKKLYLKKHILVRDVTYEPLHDYDG